MQPCKLPSKHITQHKTNRTTPTPTAAYYLETGSVQIKYLLKGRRVMYLWSILHQPEDELVSKVYNAQKMFPVKDDWYFIIKNDFDVLGMEFDEENIRKIKKEKFKKMVDENLSNEFSMKQYLTTDRLTLVEKQLLFSLRTRMFQVKCNFRNGNLNNLMCSYCHTNSEETQEHQLVCSGILEPELRNEKVKYSDIFGSIDEQVEAAKHWMKIKQIRTIKEKERESSQQRSQAH
jgi:hypothetical protein